MARQDWQRSVCWRRSRAIAAGTSVTVRRWAAATRCWCAGIENLARLKVVRGGPEAAGGRRSRGACGGD
eukprot:1160482-Prymnesium_polylepis.1